MKRLKLTVIVFFMLILTGCIQKYNITEQQSDAVAEYMAGEVLKSDVNYDQELISISDKMEDTDAVITETPAPKETVQTDTKDKDSGKQDANTGSSSEVAAEDDQEYTLSEVIGNQNFDIQYKGYKIVDTYPESKQDTYFRVDPRNGYQLLVASFKVKNVTEQKKALDISKKDITYRLDINVGTVCDPMLTLLENDLHYLDMSIDGGKSKTALLVFEISKKVDISNMNLIVTYEDKSKIIEMK